MKKFSMKNYYKLIDKIIYDILSKPKKENINFDILDTEKSRKNKLIILKEKQYQMDVGNIWQQVIGNYDGFIDLKNGHKSGLDILSHEKKIAIELKNRTNTDNNSARKYNYNKLSKFKTENPEYKCIYANINADTEKKTLNGFHKKIKNNDVEIEHYVGYDFLKLIFNNDVDKIIDVMKKKIIKYS